eukprot:833983-Pelagomonas_calceolata.AAC.3
MMVDAVTGHSILVQCLSRAGMQKHTAHAHPHKRTVAQHHTKCQSEPPQGEEAQMGPATGDLAQGAKK